MNFVHPPISVVGRCVQFISHDHPRARVVFLFPVWVTQPWFNSLLAMCSAVFILPYKGNNLFTQVSNFPCAPYVKNAQWQLACGFINLAILSPPTWQQLTHPTMQVIQCANYETSVRRGAKVPLASSGR